MLKLKGNKKDGFVIEVKDKRYIADIQITVNEAEDLLKQLSKKI